MILDSFGSVMLLLEVSRASVRKPLRRVANLNNVRCLE